MKTKFTVIAKVVILILCLSSFAKGQKTEKVDYENIKDNPYGFKSLFVGLNFLDFGYNNVTFSTSSANPLITGNPILKLGVTTLYKLNNVLTFNADLNYSLLGSLYEVGAEFSFFNKLKDGSIKFQWHSAGYLNTLKVPSKILNQYVVRAGLLSERTGVLIETKIEGSDIINGIRVERDKVERCLAKSNVIYAGIAVVTTKDRIIKIKDVKNWNTMRESRGEFYFDVMIAPKISYNNLESLSDLKSGQSVPNKTMDSLINNKIGYRIGFSRIVQRAGNFHTKFGIEFEQKPAMKNSYYLELKFAICFGYNAPNLAIKDDK